jgi:predicted permease
LVAAAERTKGGQILVSILGGLMLVVVLCHLPFLQAQFAAENRLRALFDWRTARRRFRQAPLAFLMALVVLYALATPLYLAKVRLPPQDAMWLLTVVFVASIWPTRLMVGWAYGRAVLRGQPVWPVWIWLSRLLMVPLVSLFVILLFFTQFIDEHGKLALFEHHALLLPVPF